jgi:hypothetical protein
MTIISPGLIDATKTMTRWLAKLLLDVYHLRLAILAVDGGLHAGLGFGCAGKSSALMFARSHVLSSSIVLSKLPYARPTQMKQTARMY